MFSDQFCRFFPDQDFFPDPGECLRLEFIAVPSFFMGIKHCPPVDPQDPALIFQVGKTSAYCGAGDCKHGLGFLHSQSSAGAEDLQDLFLMIFPFSMEGLFHMQYRPFFIPQGRHPANGNPIA